MPDVLLTLYCMDADRDAIARAVQEATRCVVHMRAETVFGRDFSDATTAELVSGQLNRSAIEVVMPQDAVEAVIAQVDGLKRAAPVRWHVVPVLQAGRLS